MKSLVYRTRSNDFALSEDCTGRPIYWTPRVEDVSEGGMGSQPFYVDTAKPKLHRHKWVEADLFRCERCGDEIHDMFRRTMMQTMPSLIDGLFRSSSILMSLKRKGPFFIQGLTT